jgi:hypothetical protein
MCFPIERAVEKKWDYKGLQLIVTRVDIGNPDGFSMHRCGYVRIPTGHKWHGEKYGDIDADVHGGLTFAEIELCAHEDGVGYWVGFDCFHSGDARFPHDHPNREKEYSWDHDAHYWELNEVVSETEQLADQVLSAAV